MNCIMKELSCVSRVLIETLMVFYSPLAAIDIHKKRRELSQEMLA